MIKSTISFMLKNIYLLCLFNVSSLRFDFFIKAKTALKKESSSVLSFELFLSGVINFLSRSVSNI